MTKTVEGHPSILSWPLPRGTVFPHTQTVKCAYCGTLSARQVNSRLQARSLWYCCANHKTLRRKAVLSGTMAGVVKLLVDPDYSIESDWGDLNLKPRRSLDSIPDPTVYDNKYGILPTGSDLKE